MARPWSPGFRASRIDQDEEDQDGDDEMPIGRNTIKLRSRAIVAESRAIAPDTHSSHSSQRSENAYSGLVQHSPRTSYLQQSSVARSQRLPQQFAGNRHPEALPAKSSPHYSMHIPQQQGPKPAWQLTPDMMTQKWGTCFPMPSLLSLHKLASWTGNPMLTCFTPVRAYIFYAQVRFSAP